MMSELELLDLSVELLGLIKQRTIRRGTIEDFRRSVRGSIAALWRGDISKFEFVDGMLSTIQMGYTAAWYTGAERCGVKIDELSEEERAELQRLINSHTSYAPRFADYIIEHNRESGAKLRNLYPRMEMWVNGWNEARNTAQQMACADQKLRWVWNPLKEHCSDCAALNGQVRRASFWRERGIAPQSRALECGGYRCGCRFVVSNLPLSRGRLPGLTGF